MLYADNFCTYDKKYNPDRYIYTGKCKICKEVVHVTVPCEELYKYNKGEYIQKALSSVNAEDREFLMSGICGKCWNNLFSEEY